MTHPPSTDEDPKAKELQALLGDVAERAEAPLRQVRVTRDAAEFIEHGLLILFAVPALLVLVAVSQWLFGLEAVRFSPWVVALAAIIPAVWYALIRGAIIYFKPVDRRVALALADRQLHLQDRLTTADQFLGAEQRTGFMQAAIEDAQSVLDQALHADLERPETSARGLRARGWMFAMLAIACFLGLVALDVAPAAVDPSRGVTKSGRGAAAATHEEHDERRVPRDPEISPPPQVKDRKPGGNAEKRDAERYTSDRSTETKDVKGKTGTGQSSDAARSTGMSESQGVPSDQGKVSKSEPKKAKAPKKKKKKKAPKEAKKPPKKKKSEDASGRTAGLGSGRGSNRNPTATPWSSKDRVENVDDESLEDEDEVDDEDEESESRGGMQPTLRDRKPPVSRDLTPSFGNRPNPNAKDRGGPSASKKSRGTASLVLGVPIPDQIKGQPNPGRTKITQEQIEPRSEESHGINAEERAARADAIGPWSRMSLSPWMRDLVKSYFLNLRNDKETKQ